MKMKIKNLSITLVLLLIALLISGCIDEGTLSRFNGDPVVQRAEPYVNEIVFEDITLRTKAAEIVRDCPSGDKDCQINKLYRYVVEDYSYYSDPRQNEFIQSPYDTMEVGGGDCEDLTIMLMSLLENMGINTYFVLTKDHAYGLACDVDTNNLVEYMKEPILAQVSKDLGQNGDMDVVMKGDDIFVVDEKKLTFTLEPGYIYYYGGDGTKFEDPVEYVNIEYEIYSSDPLDIYVVPSKAEYEKMIKRKSFEHFTSCANLNVLRISDSCNHITTHGGVILQNDNPDEAIIEFDLKFNFYYSTQKLLNDQQISYYEINNQSCIVLDATAGKYGYPGYDANLIGEKIAFDPLTKEYLYLEY